MDDEKHELDIAFDEYMAVGGGKLALIVARGGDIKAALASAFDAGALAGAKIINNDRLKAAGQPTDTT